MADIDHKNITQRDSQREIIIGNWTEENAIKDIESLASLNNSIISKAIAIHFFV